MRKAMIGLMVLFGLSAYAQTIPTNLLRGGAVGESESTVGSGRGGAVLFTTFPGIVNPNPFTVSSQKFTDAGIDFASQGADDFVVTGNGWHIETVEVRGTYFGGAGPAASVSIYILGNAGGLPDDTDLSTGAIYKAENLSYTDIANGDFLITLPNGGTTLLAGTYWLVVQANMEFLVGGQWGWTESSSTANSGTPVGFESAWYQTTNAFIPPPAGGAATCVDAWGNRITTCNMTESPVQGQPEPDLAFELTGTVFTPGVTVTPTTITTSEAGATASFDVVLTAPPTIGNSVTVPIGATMPAEGTNPTASLTFSGGDWDTPQTITVTPVDDALADGNITYTMVNGPATSADTGYNNLAVADVDVTNLDNEGTGVTVSPLTVSVGENGGTDTFSISLNTAPGVGETITIPITSSDTNIATVSPASVMLTNTTPVVITVTGVNNDIDAGNAGFSVVVGDPSSTTPGSPYDLLADNDTADVTGTSVDDDTAAITVAPTSGLTTTEAGGSDTFTVVLGSEPTGNVTIGVSSSDDTEGTVGAPTLTFTPANWNVAQTVTVTGEDDDIDDGNIAYTIITAPATSSDGNYDGTDPLDVGVTNNDDPGEDFGTSVSPTSGLVTTETGGTDTFTVVLDTEPTFDVSIPLNSDDATEGEISSGGPFGNALTLTFTPGNWDTAQTVTVRGLDDNVRADGDIPYTIVLGAITSGDSNYNGLNPPDVAVTNTDVGDNPSITVAPTTVSTFEDQTQAAAQATVVLGSEPTADVTVTATSSDPTEGMVSNDGITYGTNTTLTFTALNWNVAQTLFIQGQQDFAIDGDIAYTIMNTATSGDANYNGIDPADIAATNFNEDQCNTVLIACDQGIGGPLTITGEPNCTVDIYDTNGSNNPTNWTLLAAGVTIGASGTATVPGVTCTIDTPYVAVITGSNVVVSIPFKTVPTLGQWGLIAFISLLAMAAMFIMRRRTV